ncbi:MAG: hypothetical protein ACI836_000615, partial [Saprospiraceae bacterium]
MAIYHSELDYEIRYATKNKLISGQLYDCAKCLLQPEVAKVVSKAKFKDLAVFANTHKHIGKPVIAIFYIRRYLAYFLFIFLHFRLFISTKISPFFP